MYKVVEENICELLTWSTKSAIASVEQADRRSRHHNESAPTHEAPHTIIQDDLLNDHSLLGPNLPTQSQTSSVASLSGAFADDVKPGRLAYNWLDRISG